MAPKTASASVLPRTCAMPQSSRVMVIVFARACHASTSLLAVACGAGAEHDAEAATTRTRSSFFMRRIVPQKRGQRRRRLAPLRGRAGRRLVARELLEETLR